MNKYEILDLKPDASIDEIKASFRKLAHIYHPDKNNNSSESKVVFQTINNAYNTLISKEKREEYDIYLKNSRILKNRFKHTKEKFDYSGYLADISWSLKNICNQFNFILWEIEDILNVTKKAKRDNIYSGKTISEWLLKILVFIDKWALEPAGFIDYFFKARNISNIKGSDSIKNGFTNEKHHPYINLDDYFYEIRKRMDKFINKIKTNDLVKIIEGSEIRLIDSIFEVQMFSYHYLGSLNLIIKNKSSSIKPFKHSNKCYENGI